MSINYKATEKEFRTQAEMLNEDLKQIESCMKRLKGIVKGSKAYWEGEASLEHQDLFSSITDDASIIVRQLRSITAGFISDKKGESAESDAIKKSLPADFL